MNEEKKVIQDRLHVGCNKDRACIYDCEFGKCIIVVNIERILTDSKGGSQYFLYYILSLLLFCC